MKSFQQFRENIAIDQKRLELQKNVARQRIDAQKDKKKDELNKRIDQLERDLPDATADLVIDKLRRK